MLYAVPKLFREGGPHPITSEMVIDGSGPDVSDTNEQIIATALRGQKLMRIKGRMRWMWVCAVEVCAVHPSVGNVGYRVAIAGRVEEKNVAWVL